MTWEPRNKSSDGHDSDDKDSFRDTDDNSSNIDNQCLNGSSKLSVKKESDSVVEKSTALKGLSGHQTETTERGQSRLQSHSNCCSSRLPSVISLRAKRMHLRQS